MSDTWAAFNPQPASDDPWATFKPEAAAKPTPETGVDIDRASPFVSSPSEAGFAASVPDAFLDRLRRGQALGRILNETLKGVQEGFGDEPIAGSDAHLDHLLHKLSIDREDSKASPLAIDMVAAGVAGMKNPAMVPVRGLASIIDATMRGINSGLHASAGGIGQIIDEVGGDGAGARKEIINFGNFAMIEGGMGRFSRPAVGRIGPGDQPIGGLPKPADFTTSAELLAERPRITFPKLEGHGFAKPPDQAAIARSVEAAERNLRDLWEERGIHPAEAVHDAQSDAFLRQQITRPFIEVYHGSPHEFETFSLEKIGTGEGAQSYGYGLYFAENEAVGRSYQSLKGTGGTGGSTVGGKPFDVFDPMHEASSLVHEYGSREAALKEQRARIAEDPDAPGDFNQEVLRHLESNEPLPPTVPMGNFYRTRINADREHFLDWDKPVGEQPANVQSALRSAFDKLRSEFPVLRSEFEFDKPATGSITGSQAVKELENVAGRERASAALREAGIPGIKYLDQGSRNAPDVHSMQRGADGKIYTYDEFGAAIDAFDTLEQAKASRTSNTSNFVVFDDKLVEITHKNGIALRDMTLDDALEASQVAKVEPSAPTPADAVAPTPGVDLPGAESRVAGQWVTGQKAEQGYYRLPTKNADGQVVGHTEFIHYPGEKTVSINAQYIDAAERGKGLGLKSVQSIVDWAHSKGWGVESSLGLNESSKGIYEALKRRGYEVISPQVEKRVSRDIEAKEYETVTKGYVLPAPETAAAGRKSSIDPDAAWVPAHEADRLRALGADVTGEVMPTLAQQPPPRPGRLAAAMTAAADKLFDIGRDIQMKVAPMATGARDTMAITKDFANTLRRNSWEWARIDDDVAGRFMPEQRTRMFNAMDEESVAIQKGESREHQGLATLDPAERATVEDIDARQQLAWMHARDIGMVEGDGIPMHATRFVLNIANASDKDGALSLDAIGRNLTVRTPQLRHRKYLTVEETEAAAKAKFGEQAVVARDIRAVILSTAKLEDAIAGRTLINNIKEYGKRTGADTVTEGASPGEGWFTIDHPALRTWRPRLEEADTAAYREAVARSGGVEVEGARIPARDADGNIIFEQVPIYVHGDFEGPLRAVLTQPSGATYQTFMELKAKTMSMIMNSPMIHFAVEWGRALPAMPGKVATFRVYFEGNRAKKDVAVMHEAIDGGLVPIGKRFFNQDITSIMESPDLTPGRSWTAKILAAVPGLFDEAAGTAVKRAIDKAGDFWHNTLLWDRIGDLQMGLYTNLRDDMLGKGIDRQTAVRAAAHWANRYAGALPQEAMSDAARKVSNVLMFSRSFTLGNLGAMKDMLTGLPKDVLAQIERDAGFRAGAINKAGELAGPEAQAVSYAKTMARRKAMAIVGLDIALMYVGNSLLQSALNVMVGDNTLGEELHGYAQRFVGKMQSIREHPLELLQPFGFFQSLSATADNEPGRENRIHVGATKDGTAIYARNPSGKIGEEFEGYLTGPLDMIRRKLGTIARPAWQIMSNDAGFGRKIVDPTADTPAKYLKNIGAVVGHLVRSQFPEGQFDAASDLVKGEGDAKLNALQAFGPLAGVTFSKGAPGGPAVGELYHAREMHNFQINAALPDIRKQFQRGDIAEARQRMNELGIPPGLQRFYEDTSINPATARMRGRTLTDFYRYATPERRERLDRARVR